MRILAPTHWVAPFRWIVCMFDKQYNSPDGNANPRIDEAKNIRNNATKRTYGEQSM